MYSEFNSFYLLLEQLPWIMSQASGHFQVEIFILELRHFDFN